MQSNLSLPSLLGPLWPGMVAPDRVLSIGQIELNWAKLNCLKWNYFLTLKFYTYCWRLIREMYQLSTNH